MWAGRISLNIFSFDPAYERKAYLSRLRQIRTRHAHELSIKSEEILKNVKIYVHVVHGIPEQKLLWAAERHVSPTPLFEQADTRVQLGNRRSREVSHADLCLFPALEL